MNERIKQLVEQAKLKTELWNNPEPFVIYKEDVNYPGGLEKFAELIVRESISVLTESMSKYDERASFYPYQIVDLINVSLNKHFEVEE